MEDATMTLSWSPVVIVDSAGSVLMLVLSTLCAVYSWRLTQKKPDDIFRNYIFFFTIAIVFFSVSRSFGHLFKQLLLLNDMAATWKQIAPYSGAVNSTTFVVIFAFGISFHRFQKVHNEIEYYKGNLEELIEIRTNQLEKSRNTLENILDNSNPINITTVNFDLVQANKAYYDLWPKVAEDNQPIKCYESRPGEHCGTDNCPMKLIIEGEDKVVQEVSKELNGETRDFIVTARPFRDVNGELIGMVESFQEITLRKRAEKAMRESEERFRKIFQSNPEPVILAGLTDGNVIDVNNAFELLTGVERAVALGKNVEELNLWSVSAETAPLFEVLKDGGEINNIEVAFKTKGARIKTGLVSATWFKVNDDPCALIVIRDITTEKAAEQALLKMDQMKSEFISTAAHELNTPLSTMMGYAEILRDPGEFGRFDEAKNRDFLNEIFENGEALSRIIADLLDISRIESGKPIPLDREQEDLTEILSKKVKAYVLLDSDHVFHLDLPEQLRQPLITVDRLRINQALENLLSNAVKYSPTVKEITVRAREGANGWEVSVEDQGIGMNEDQVNMIFDKFYRADASNTAVKGLGLGMSIVKQIIEAHGGRIWVESVESVGTKVIFNLPYSNG
jgi:PAS domain S-box-containing protein